MAAKLSVSASRMMKGEVLRVEVLIDFAPSDKSERVIPFTIEENDPLIEDIRRSVKRSVENALLKQGLIVKS